MQPLLGSPNPSIPWHYPSATAALIRCCLYFCNWLQLAAVACNYSCHTRIHQHARLDGVKTARRKINFTKSYTYTYVCMKKIKQILVHAKVNGENAMKFEHRLWVRPIDRPKTQLATSFATPSKKAIYSQLNVYVYKTGWGIGETPLAAADSPGSQSQTRRHRNPFQLPRRV